MTKSKAMCAGCQNDYYNRTEKNGCWSFASATVVTRVLVGYWQNPPYELVPMETLSCHRPEGQVWIEVDDCRIRKEEATNDAQ